MVDNSAELTVEVRVINNTSFVNNLSKISGVINVVLASYNGDYAS